MMAASWVVRWVARSADVTAGLMVDLTEVRWAVCSVDPKAVERVASTAVGMVA